MLFPKVFLPLLLALTAPLDCSGFSSSKPIGSIQTSTFNIHNSRNTPTRSKNTRAVEIQRISLQLASSNDDGEIQRVKVDSAVRDASLLLRRLSWFAWWSQLILTTVAGVTLLFAKNVIQESTTSGMGSSLPNFLLAGTGIVFSLGSIFWTWATRRLARRLLKKPTTRVKAANMLRKSINVGVTINLLGMLSTIMGAEQIVGALAIKVLTTARTVAILESSSLLQPLDILVVQANTNTLFSHFTSLVALLYVSRSILKLDPPSIEGDERRR